MNTTTRPFPAGELRVSDADRDLAIDELSEHFQSGRLSKEEFDDRSARALRARTGRELSELFADLPGGAAPRGQAAPAAPAWQGPAWDVPALAGPSRRRLSRLDRSPRCRPAGALLVGVLAAIAIVSVPGSVVHASLGFGWAIAVILVVWAVRRVTRVARRGR